MKHETILDFLFLGSAAFCSLGVGLFLDPLPASAVEIGAGGEAQIEEYLDTAGENLGALDFQFNSDQDGNRNIRVKIFGLQQLAFTAQSGFYGGLDFSAAPDTMTVSGGGGVGFYRHNQNSEPLPATVFSCRPGEIMAQSEEFSITVRYGIESMNADCVPYSDSVSAGFKYTGSGYYSPVIYHDSMGFLSDISQSYSIFTNDVRAYTFSQNNIPIVTPGTRCDLVSFGSGSSLTLPPGTVDSSRPWDYYNNVLLPYMEQEFPGFDEYFVFPDGYFPQEPTEPITIPFLEPTSPNWDIIGGEIGTNPPGADDAVYDVSDPGQLGLPLPDPGFDKIHFSLSSFGDSIAFWFAFLGRVCDSLHITPVLTIALCLGAVGFILWKVGS